MNTLKRIAVAGATGRLGRHVTDLLGAGGHDVVAISRSGGVDVMTGEGLAAALEGVSLIVDAATGSSADQKAATEFFTAASRNLHELGEQAGVEEMIVVSIIGTDRFTTGYNAAKATHEEVARSGSIPVRVLRAAQFHEFVGQLVQWGTRDDVSYVPEMRSQLVAAKSVAEVLVDMATRSTPAAPSAESSMVEVAGPRAEDLVEMAALLVAASGAGLRVEGVRDPLDPDRELYETGALLPGPDAILAGPTFEQWLSTQ